MKVSKIASTMSAMLLGGLLTGTAAFSASIPMLSFPVMNSAEPSTFNMADHKNTVFVFEGMRLDCTYCNQNVGNVDALATAFANNPRVKVVDLCIDSSSAMCKQWVARHKPNHPVLHDVGRQAFMALKQENAVPQAFIVDCHGNLSGFEVGLWDSAASMRMKDKIMKALETTCE